MAIEMTPQTVLAVETRDGALNRWLAGAPVIFRKELGEWFRTRRFLVSAALTTLMLSSVPMLFFLHEGGLHDGRVDSGYPGLLRAWTALSLTLASYLVVALVMGVMVKEEESGTAQWVLTKPVSRVGYVLAKYAATLLVVEIAVVLIPGVFFVGLTGAIESAGIRNWNVIGLIAGLCALNAAVAVAFVFAFSAHLRSTAPIAGIAIAIGFLPLFFFGIVDQKVTSLFPVNMGAIASHAADGEPLRPWAPVVVSAVVVLVSPIIASWSINRRQLQ
jgi:ABC-2 type transport system permease protein